MIKAAIEKIQEMCRGQVFDIDGEHYSDMKLQRIEPPEYRPSVLKLYSLDALIEILKEETSKIDRAVRSARSEIKFISAKTF